MTNQEHHQEEKNEGFLSCTVDVLMGKTFSSEAEKIKFSEGIKSAFLLFITEEVLDELPETEIENLIRDMEITKGTELQHTIFVNKVLNKYPDKLKDYLLLFKREVFQSRLEILQFQVDALHANYSPTLVGSYVVTTRQIIAQINELIARGEWDNTLKYLPKLTLLESHLDKAFSEEKTK